MRVHHIFIEHLSAKVLDGEWHGLEQLPVVEDRAQSFADEYGRRVKVIYPDHTERVFIP